MTDTAASAQLEDSASNKQLKPRDATNSNSAVAISVNDVGKMYRLYKRPQDRLKEHLLGRFGKHFSREFWALRNVSFEIHKGETVGIVGRNGSGKSTLLQIIAGTLTPTAGRVNVAGRVSALLELGSGFNPEFTGRENVFVSGAILGIGRDAMMQRFEQIAEFADIGEFINQPVKIYSSGMYVRLAFAVAISVEPDILIIDETLSVGDESFQRKCFARIESIQERGGTILFVSHSATAVVELCNRAVLLERGELLLAGSPKFVVNRYHRLLFAPADKAKEIRDEIRREQRAEQSDSKAAPRQGAAGPATAKTKAPEESFDPGLVPQSTVSYVSRGASIVHPRILTEDGKMVNVLKRRRTYLYTYFVKFDNPAHKVQFSMLIKTVSGFELGGAWTRTPDREIGFVEAGAVVRAEFRFRCLLQPGVYFLNAGVLGAANGETVYLDRKIDLAMFRVQPEANIVSTAVMDFCIEPRISAVDAAELSAIDLK